MIIGKHLTLIMQALVLLGKKTTCLLSQTAEMLTGIFCTHACECGFHGDSEYSNKIQ